MKINILSIPTGYKATFELNPGYEYYMLALLLELDKKWECGYDPVDAVELLVKTTIESIRSLGITSTPLIDVINDAANEKIKELEAIRINLEKKIKPIYVETKPSGSGYSAYTVVNDYEPYDITDEISALTTTLDFINGRGLSKKKALENYIHNLESYEAMVHTFITQVKELSKEELNEDSH